MSYQHVPPPRLPLSYRYGPGRVVEEDPDIMPLVMEARRMREEGHSIRTVCRVMHSRGLRGRSGKRLSTMGMWKVLGKSNVALEQPVRHLNDACCRMVRNHEAQDPK